MKPLGLSALLTYAPTLPPPPAASIASEISTTIAAPHTQSVVDDNGTTDVNPADGGAGDVELMAVRGTTTSTTVRLPLSLPSLKAPLAPAPFPYPNPINKQAASNSISSRAATMPVPPPHTFRNNAISRSTSIASTGGAGGGSTSNVSLMEKLLINHVRKVTPSENLR